MLSCRRLSRFKSTSATRRSRRNLIQPDNRAVVAAHRQVAQFGNGARCPARPARGCPRAVALKHIGQTCPSSAVLTRRRCPRGQPKRFGYSRAHTPDWTAGSRSGRQTCPRRRNFGFRLDSARVLFQPVQSGENKLISTGVCASWRSPIKSSRKP